MNSSGIGDCDRKRKGKERSNEKGQQIQVFKWYVCFFAEESHPNCTIDSIIPSN